MSRDMEISLYEIVHGADSIIKEGSKARMTFHPCEGYNVWAYHISESRRWGKLSQGEEFGIQRVG